MDEHVEHLRVGLRPPGNAGLRGDRELLDGRVSVSTGAFVAADDLGAWFAFTYPQGIAIGEPGVIEPAVRFREGSTKDIPEVHRF
jgi:hypothetical protein